MAYWPAPTSGQWTAFFVDLQFEGEQLEPNKQGGRGSSEVICNQAKETNRREANVRLPQAVETGQKAGQI